MYLYVCAQVEGYPPLMLGIDPVPAPMRSWADIAGPEQVRHTRLRGLCCASPFILHWLKPLLQRLTPHMNVHDTPAAAVNTPHRPTWVLAAVSPPLTRS